MSKTIGEMTAEIREVNIAKGWRPAEGGPGANTWGDYVALLHSKISEALVAYRDHGLADATSTREIWPAGGDGPVPIKPEGVGSELADVLIRLLDMCDVFGYEPCDPSVRLEDLNDARPDPWPTPQTFGDHLTWLHYAITQMWMTNACTAPYELRVLVTTARKYGIDLDAEYERKIAYNRTREFQHGGRTLAGKARPEPTPAERLERLKAAMPAAPRDWRTGEGMNAFVDEWNRLGLPGLVMSEASRELVIFWTRDLSRAGRMLGTGLWGDVNPSIDIERGEYTASIVQAAS